MAFILINSSLEKKTEKIAGKNQESAAKKRVQFKFTTKR